MQKFIRKSCNQRLMNAVHWRIHVRNCRCYCIYLIVSRDLCGTIAKRLMKLSIRIDRLALASLATPSAKLLVKLVRKSEREHLFSTLAKTCRDSRLSVCAAACPRSRYRLHLHPYRLHGEKFRYTKSHKSSPRSVSHALFCDL